MLTERTSNFFGKPHQRKQPPKWPRHKLKRLARLKYEKRGEKNVEMKTEKKFATVRVKSSPLILIWVSAVKSQEERYKRLGGENGRNGHNARQPAEKVVTVTLEIIYLVTIR